MAEDPRDDSTLVTVVYKSHVESGEVANGINPGVVTLGWLRLGDNAKNWVEIDPATGKKLTPAQAVKATTGAGQEG